MPIDPSAPDRRRFLLSATALCGGAFLPKSQADPAPIEPAAPSVPTAPIAATVLREPDSITAFAGLKSPHLLTLRSGLWHQDDIAVRLQPELAAHELSLRLASPDTRLTHLHLRWQLRISSELRCLGDAWERSYGDLEWRGLVPNRVLPWYFLTLNGASRSSSSPALQGAGVKTQPAAFCFWQLDPEGISLWADIRNGGNPLALGQRELHVATIVSLEGQPGELPHAVAHRLCRALCPEPRLPASPIYGSNDWNYAYGHNTAPGILRDADLVASLAPAGPHRPLVVIDDGWQDKSRFPDMARLASEIRARGPIPGLWIRPLRAPKTAPANLLLPAARFAPGHPSPAYDPTIPEALERILDAVRAPVSWGYQFIKHDFSTWEFLGRWGFEMGPSPTSDGWGFHDPSLTTAEVILRFYQALRQAAGDGTTILGCNTVGHLAAGVFHSQRTGDDTSGTLWERTRRMGVNTLAFRLPQHAAFFHIDPDIVAITTGVAWTLTRQWLDVVARSGASLFIAPQPDAMGSEQRAVVRQAFELVQSSQGYAEDWLDNTAPTRWRFQESPPIEYDWSGSEGAWPFSV